MDNRERVLTLGVIRDYILKYFPELLWWDGIHTHQKWNDKYNFKHRQGMLNEIRIEFDSEDKNSNWENINYTALELNKNGYSFAIYYADGGRSPHIHIYDLDELETLNYEERILYRKLFLEKVCPKNSNPDLELCDEKHLCALEFVNHFKYNKPKKILCYIFNGRNIGIDFDIKYNIMFDKKTQLLLNPIKKEFVKKEFVFGDLINKRKSDFIFDNLNFETVFEKYNIKYKNKLAQCPLHNDTKFSLSFSNEKKVWHCFGCHIKGDIITLIKLLRERENE